jgi:hypothetical protein
MTVYASSNLAQDNLHTLNWHLDNAQRASNVERTGKRDMTLSTQLRKVGGKDTLSDNVRHKDGDFQQYCHKCKKVLVWMEGSADPNRATTYIRAAAEDTKHTSIAMKVVHHPNDIKGTKGVREVIAWRNGREVIFKGKNISWDVLIKSLEQIAYLHEKSKECVRRKSFK